MAVLKTERETKKIKLQSAEGGEAEVYTSLTAGDTEKLYNEGALSQEKPQLVKIALRAIAGWNLTDENGAALEVNEDNVRKLRTNDVTAITKEAFGDFLPQEEQTGESDKK